MENESKRILVAIDFSDSSERALAEACRLAALLGARIDLAYVAPPPVAAASEVIGVVAADVVNAKRHRESLAAMALALSKDGVHAEPHLRIGTVVMSLLDLIKQLQPSLVVVGSHGKSAVTRALVGSVAESLIRRSPVPVLVVPSPRRHAAAERTAWSCNDCGHILANNESTSQCAHCNVTPAQWISAPMAPDPIDAGEPAVGEVDRETVASAQSNEPAGLFATSPGGVEGYDVNPELRVRY